MLETYGLKIHCCFGLMDNQGFLFEGLSLHADCRRELGPQDMTSLAENRLNRKAIYRVHVVLNNRSLRAGALNFRR